MSAEFTGFAFSTSWNWRGTDSGTRVVEEVLALGFDAMELNYKVTREMMKTITPYVEQGRLTVPSVHNVFPFYDDKRFDTDSRLLGYEDEELRLKAVELTIASVDAGHALGAQALVVHPGVVPFRDPTPGPGGLTGEECDYTMKQLWLNHGPQSPEFLSFRDEFLGFRQKRMGGEMERILKSLETVANHIVQKNIPMRLGLENRPMAFQIPTFTELKTLLDALAGAPVGFWFDTGHGAMMRHMGFFDDTAEAPAFADQLVGMHIHDVVGVDDHWAPYTREGLAPYLELIRRSPVKVIELGVKNQPDDIVAGMRRLKAALAGEPHDYH